MGSKAGAEALSKQALDVDGYAVLHVRNTHRHLCILDLLGEESEASLELIEGPQLGGEGLVEGCRVGVCEV